MTRPCLGINIIGPAQVAGQSVNWRTFKELKSWMGPDACPPGDMHGDAVLVSGRVRASFNAAVPRFATFPVVEDPLSLLLPTQMPFVKLGISDCDQSGEIIIDSDQTVVIYGPQVQVRVLVPNLPSWAEAISPSQTGEWSASLKVRVCPAPCCPSWPPVLTESHQQAATVDLDLTIPRHARSFSATDVANNLEVRWFNGPPAAGGVLIGTSLFAADGFLSVIPSATHIRIIADPAVTRDLALRWEIAP